MKKEKCEPKITTESDPEDKDMLVVKKEKFQDLIMA